MPAEASQQYKGRAYSKVLSLSQSDGCLGLGFIITAEIAGSSFVGFFIAGWVFSLILMLMPEHLGAQSSLSESQGHEGGDTVRYENSSLYLSLLSFFPLRIKEEKGCI